MNLKVKTKYSIDITSNFKKQYKKCIKQGKDINKFIEILELLANGKKLDEKYRDHSLINNNSFYNCRECHIEPD